MKRKFVNKYYHKDEIVLIMQMQAVYILIHYRLI